MSFMNIYSDRAGESKTVQHGFPEQSTVNKSAFYLQDNRCSATVQKKQKKGLTAKAVENRTGIVATTPIQRVKVDVVHAESNLKEPVNSVNSPLPVQAVHVTEYKSGTAISDHLLKTAIEEMTKIVEKAESAKKEEGKGVSHGGDEYARLEKMLKREDVKKMLPSSSNSTFGLGGSNYFGDTPFTTTQGPSAFDNGIKGIPDVGTVEHLGNRNTGLHDEMYHITEYPGLQALASSQGHCFFCYGVIHDRGYEHGSLRESPWPTMWKHDYLGFGLKQTAASSVTIGLQDNPVIKIESDSFGTRYYYVTKA